MKYLKKYKAFVSVAIVVSLIVIFWPSAGQTSSSQTSSGRIEDVHIAKAQYPAGDIYGKYDLNQTFISNVDNLAEVQVLFATWARKNTGSLFVKISEVGGEEFFSETLDMAKMADNTFISFKFEPIKDSRDRKYLINLSSPESTSGNSVTCWGMLENIPKGFELTHGGIKSNLVIVFNTFTA